VIGRRGCRPLGKNDTTMIRSSTNPGKPYLSPKYRTVSQPARIPTDRLDDHTARSRRPGLTSTGMFPPFPDPLVPIQQARPVGLPHGLFLPPCPADERARERLRVVQRLGRGGRRAVKMRHHVWLFPNDSVVDSVCLMFGSRMDSVWQSYQRRDRAVYVERSVVVVRGSRITRPLRGQRTERDDQTRGSIGSWQRQRTIEENGE